MTAGEAKFAVHKDVLTKVSPFFKAALSDMWAAGKDVLDLPEDDPVLLAMAIHWAYWKEIMLPTSLSMEEPVEVMLTLVALYILADKFGFTALKNLVLDFLQRKVLVRYLPSKQAIDLAFNLAPKDSKLRAKFSDLWAYCASASDLVSTKQSWPRDMVESVFDTLASKKADSASEAYAIPKKNQEKCYYHEHDEWAPACKPTKPTSESKTLKRKAID